MIAVERKEGDFLPLLFTSCVDLLQTPMKCACSQTVNTYYGLLDGSVMCTFKLPNV